MPVNARPIGAKRSPSLTTTYHLSFSSPEQANKAHTLISQRPLFAAAGTRATPARSQDHLGLRLDDRGTPRVMFIASPAEEWAERSLARAAREGVRPKLAGAESTSDHIGVQWALDRGSRNRRVLITGLPFRATPAEVNKLASGVGELAEVACRQVPHAAWSNTSAWAVTAASVAQAYQIARKLNRNYFAQEKWGTRYLMRAHVHP